MKIVHIITGLNDGGAESVLYRLCVADKKNEHIVISFLDEGKYGELLYKVNIQVHTLGMQRGLFALFTLYRLYFLIRSLRPDVVQTWMYHADLLGGLMARLSGICNVVWTIRNSTLVLGKSKFSTIVIARLNAWLSYLVPKHIVSCSYSGVAVHHAIGYTSKKMIVIDNGYDLEKFTPNQKIGEQLRSQLNISSDVFVVGMVARFNPQKDHANLLKALSLLKVSGAMVRCVMVGDGITVDNQILAAMLDKYSVADIVHLAGQSSDMPAMMNAFDLNILSSAYGEAFPNVVAEAMACGTPCVVTDVGDAARIVADAGWVVEPQNSEALARAINLALGEWSNKPIWQLRKILSRKIIVSHYSLEVMLDSYRKLWRT